MKLVFEVLLTNNIDNNNNNNNNIANVNANANVKKRNIVIVGDSAGVSKGIVMEVMRRFERGEVPHPELRKTKFVSLFEFLSPVSLRLMNRQDVEKRLLELKTKLQEELNLMMITTTHHDHDRHRDDGVIILYTGDLKWTVDDDQDHDHYKAVDHVVEEIAGIVNENNKKKEKNKKEVRIMGSASYQTYMRCQMREPPLEMQWSLHAVSLPACSPALALTLHSNPPPPPPHLHHFSR